MKHWKAAVALTGGLGLLAFLAVPVVLLGVGSGSGEQVDSAGISCPAATLTAVTTSDSQLTKDQLSNAEIIIEVGNSISGVGQSGEIVAITASFTESHLINVDHGDADSLGLFQERPSQGWGTPAEIMDPAYSSRQFYSHLLGVPGWQQMAPGDAAQAVEASAFPGRYAASVPIAEALVGGAITAVGASVTLDNCLGSSGATVKLPDGVTLPQTVVEEIDSAPAPVQTAIQFALDQVGCPYVWGGVGPCSAGFDCSGLVQQAYASAGVSIPRTSEDQFAQLTPVKSALLPGDLIYFEGVPPGHVELYLGGGLVVEAPHTGTLVKVTHLPRNSTGASRVIPQ